MQAAATAKLRNVSEAEMHVNSAQRRLFHAAARLSTIMVKQTRQTCFVHICMPLVDSLYEACAEWPILSRFVAELSATVPELTRSVGLFPLSSSLVHHD
jgi:hypothetical protein